MLKLYDLLEGVLNDIEKRLKDDIGEKALAEKFLLSQVHLRRLFRFAFGRTIGAYLRSRKLASSIEDLLHTNTNILDIALDYGFEHEQSYIRAFRREFEITPGCLRKTGQILKITPPLHLFDSNRLADGLFFGPEIVMIPRFHVVGRKYKLPFRDALVLAPFMRKEVFRERMKIPNAVDRNVFININSDSGTNDYSWLMPSIQVKTLDNIPEEFDRYTFPTSLCAKFRFIAPEDTVLNMAVVDGMFKAIDDFMDDENQKYFLERKRINIDRFASLTSDGFGNVWEWFAPVIEKTKINFSMNPDGIIKTYRQEVPALRFIGKKYNEPFSVSIFDKILNELDNWCLRYAFSVIEKQLDKESKTIYEGGDAYVSLIKINGELLNEVKQIEYWLGMFMPEGTEVPSGYEMMDFPKSTLGVCAVYGKRNSIIHYDEDCRKELAKEGIECRKDETGAKLFFQRFNWRNFYSEDKYGKRVLEYCYYL